MTKNEKYLKTFFEEKEIPFEIWLVEANGTVHQFDTEVLQEQILAAPEHEREQIAHVIRKIDFYNGDVLDFFKHLSQALAQNWE